ncbi:hypothetical protein Sango_1895500 [Sesamum angolense]|uniref:DUF4283 domain-containing protein n=1 Tax=Sesamum angolense TaxID=2727404 RepID=A0AAE2BQM6_9LAMI|nr:hypothetical protein Sango_1895500 [Sesamum angolense]
MINAKTSHSTLQGTDFTRLWLRRIWTIQGFPMRIFKWDPTFNPSQESSVVPLWVEFPELPAHLFQKDALFAVANMVGTPLQLDDFAVNQATLTCAKVCIEVDLNRPLLEEFIINIRGVNLVQKVVYEQAPQYCKLCKHISHQEKDCYASGNAPKPAKPNLRHKAQARKRNIV